MKAVTGEIPSNDPMDIEMASTQYATVDLSKSFVVGSTRPESLAIVYNVLDAENGAKQRKKVALYAGQL